MEAAIHVQNIPSIKRREFKARSRSSSHELNKLQKEAFADILNLFNNVNTLKKSLYELNMISMAESCAYARRLEECMKETSLLKERYENILLNPDDIKTLTVHAGDAIEDPYGDYQSQICRNTGDVIHALAGSSSKTRLYDETYDETLVPPGLKIYLGPDSFKEDGAHIYSIEDSDIYNAMDGNANTAWLRRVVTDTRQAVIENEIVIGLPEDIITSRLVNQVTVSPFPSGDVDVMYVKYKTGGEWKTVEGFNCHEGYGEEETTDIFGNKKTIGCIKDSPNLRLNFRAVQTNQVKIGLRQRHFTYDEANNRRIWYLGLRDLGVNLNRYLRDPSSFAMVFHFPETSGKIKVYGADIVCNNHVDPETLEHVSKEYYYYDSDDNCHKVASSLPFMLDGKKMMLRVTLSGSAEETPNVSKCSIRYKTVGA